MKRHSSLNKRYSGPSKLMTLAVAVAAAPAMAVTGDFGLEEVVVTAQKREQSLQDVPVSVSALTGGDVEGLKLRNSTEIQSQVPNLQVSTPYGDTQPFFALRGVATLDYSVSQSSPIAMYVDEGYKGVGALQSLQLFDLERIEVLRGPQGTLYGKNATGGAVNFVSKKPSFEGNQGYVQVGVGNYDKREVKGGFETVLVDDVLAARAAFTVNKADGWLKNKYPGADDLADQDDWAGRMTFVYKPAENFEATLRLSKSRSTGTGSAVIALNNDPAVTGQTIDHLDWDEIEETREGKKEIENSATSLTLNWDVSDNYSLIAITTYDEGKWIAEDGEGLLAHIDENDYFSEVDQFSQEFRVVSNYDGPFNWIGGLYYAKDEVDVHQHYRFLSDFEGVSGYPGTYGVNSFNSFTQERSSKAAYLHTTYDLTEDLSLTFGLRYTKDRVEMQDMYALFGFYPSAPTSDEPKGDDGIELWSQVIPEIPESYVDFSTGQNLKGDITFPTVAIEDNNLSGKIGLDWQASEDVMLYISYSEGYRGSAINGQALYSEGEVTSVDPEELESLELGIKGQFFDNRVQLNGAIFRYDYTNLQFIDFRDGLQVLVSAEESEVIGAELELTAMLSENLVLRSGIGYLDTEFKELSISGTDYSGNELPLAPEINFNTMINWDFARTEAGVFSLQLDTSFTDKQFYDGPNTARTAQDGYWLTNGRLSFTSADDRYSVGLWGRNLANKEYIVYSLPLAEYGFGLDYTVRGTPRTYGADFTFRF